MAPNKRRNARRAQHAQRNPAIPSGTTQPGDSPVTTQSYRPILRHPEASTSTTRSASDVRPVPSLAPPAQPRPAYSSGTTQSVDSATTTQGTRPILRRPEGSMSTTRFASNVRPVPSLAPPAQPRNPAFSSGATQSGEFDTTTEGNWTILRRPEASTPATRLASGVHPGSSSLPTPRDIAGSQGQLSDGFWPVPRNSDLEERFRPWAHEIRGGGFRVAPPAVRLPERPEYSGGTPRGRISRGALPVPRSVPVSPGQSKGASRVRNSRAAMSFPRGGTGLERSKGVRGNRRSRPNGVRRGGGRALNSHANSSQHSHRRTPLSLGLPTASDRENKSFTQGNKQQQTRGAFGWPGVKPPPTPRFPVGTQSAVPSKRAAEDQMTSGAEKRVFLPNQVLISPVPSTNATMVDASTQTMPEVDRGPELSLSARSDDLVVSNSPPNALEHSTDGHEASRIPENDVREDVAHGAETVAEWSPATRQGAEDVAAEGPEGQAMGEDGDSMDLTGSNPVDSSATALQERDKPWRPWRSCIVS